MRKTSCIILLLTLLADTMANPVTSQLQELLNAGADLVLEKGRVYEIDANLYVLGESIFGFLPYVNRLLAEGGWIKFIEISPESPWAPDLGVVW